VCSCSSLESVENYHTSEGELPPKRSVKQGWRISDKMRIPPVNTYTTVFDIISMEKIT